jgi:lipopolysaccharide export system protein LptC
MLRKLRTFGPLVLFAALLLALGYWNIRPESFLDRPAAQVDDAEIDFYVDNSRIRQYQPDGKLQYEMTATKLEHVKASDVTLVSSPDLMLYRGTELPVPRSRPAAPRPS